MHTHKYTRGIIKPMQPDLARLFYEFQKLLDKKIDTAKEDLMHELEIADIELTHESLSGK